MKALFLAGGKGTRMQPLTDGLPKPMVPVMNRPLLERTMLNLKKCGISEVVISTCYQPDYIKNYFSNGNSLDMGIDYIVEDSPMGTGGAVKKAEGYFHETFVVFNSDILSDIDLCKMIDFHKSQKALATIAVTEVDDPSVYGVIEYDADGRIMTFKEKPQPGETTSNSINAGIYIFEPEIFKEIPADRPVSIEREVFPKLLKKGKRMAAYQSGSYWMDLGTIEKYRQTHKDIMAGKCRLVDCDFNSDDISFGRNVKIHPESVITGPAYIGDNVVIGAKVIIRNSVIGNNVSINGNSRITGSILWDDVTVSKNARLVNTIVTAGCYVHENTNYLNTVCTNEITELSRII